MGDAAQVFSLHSKPGASKVFYLDFDGHTITKTAWSGGATLVALPFDPSGNDSPSTVANFTAEELNIIAEVWHRIAEDYAAFDIDITTEEPEAFNRTTGRMLFTRNVDANGQPMPSQNAGGTAFCQRIRPRRGLFNVPVDPVALGLPDYFAIIKQPMDLGTVKKRLHSLEYKSRRECAEEIVCASATQ